jgi:hypothetical protein
MAKLNFKEVKDFILEVSTQYGATTVFNKDPDWEDYSFGDVDVHQRHINLYPNPKGEYKNLRELLGTFFHELAHIYCFENDIYGRYYTPGGGRMTVNYAYKAELATDRWGECLMNCFLSGMKYHAWYKTHKKEALDLLGRNL